MNWNESDSHSGLKLDEDPSAAYYTPMAVPKGRKKKKRPAFTSTPSTNSRSATKTLQTSVWDDSSSLFSCNERYSTLLKQIHSLEKSWNSEYTRSCDAFTRLATCILYCSQGRMPDGITLETMPLDAAMLLRNGQTEQAHKLCFGYAMEQGFAEVESHLVNMRERRTQIHTWVGQLAAVGELAEQSSQLSFSSPKPSLGGNSYSPILWTGIIAESHGLLSRIDRDLNCRQRMLLDATSQCLTADGAYRLALLWRHLGSLLRWSAVTELTDHALEIIERSVY